MKQEQFDMLYIQIKDLNINLAKIGHYLNRIDDVLRVRPIKKEELFSD